jgi:hypothetical protein
MKCTESLELLALYVEGDLARSDSASVERHLADCADCRVRTTALIESQALLMGSRADRVPDDVVLGVRRSVLDRIEENPGAVLGWPVRLERAVLSGVRRPLVAATFGAVVLGILALVPLRVWPPAGEPRPVADFPAAESETVSPGASSSSALASDPDPEADASREGNVGIAVADSGDDVAGIRPVEAPGMAGITSVEAPGVAVAERPDDNDSATPAGALSVTIDWTRDTRLQIPPQRSVKLVTDDPGVIIYWVLEENEEGGGA